MMTTLALVHVHLQGSLVEILFGIDSCNLDSNMVLQNFLFYKASNHHMELEPTHFLAAILQLYCI